MFILLFGLGLPILAAAGVIALPIKSDGLHSTVLWLVVCPVAIAGVLFGAWLDATF